MWSLEDAGRTGWTVAIFSDMMVTVDLGSQQIRRTDKLRRRRIDEANIRTPVEVDQRATKCLEQAAWSLTVIRSRCCLSRAEIFFRRPLPIFIVVRCSLVDCFQIRVNVELFCSHELQLRERKIILLEGR
ncbi:uncharacterized protein TNCV_1535031 [Trichonephila clavipes]|uniref:Uncharacterized protein n=1 Tax=Trichonephila clavipes TaxID=2585209 RepID=A0A8X6RDR5_TRICX|nr:uncharacterized protein TNCV_1535031 [Trichonephila clavipes]